MTYLKKLQKQFNSNKMPAGNTGLAKVAVQCSADTFMVNQSLVLRINLCGENRHLRQARNRYPTFKKIWLFIEIKKNYDKNRIEKGLYELTLLECNFYADGLNSDATFI